jgi:hypothetical protein
MMSPCDGVAERLACGEPLAELAAHAEDCPRCGSLLATQRLLAAGATGGRSLEPSPGFTSRMTVMAGHRLVSRQRRRIAGYAALSAGAAAMLTFAVMRTPERGSAPAPVAQRERKDVLPASAGANPPVEQNPWEAPVAERDTGEEELELTSLAHSYADPVSADWSEIERPLLPYRQLLRLVATPSFESFHPPQHDEPSDDEGE